VIAEFLYLDDDTVRNWHKQYQSGGLDLLTTFEWKGGLTFLNTAQQAGLCDWLDEKRIKHRCKDTSGRQRVNIHGALCLESFDTPFGEVIKVNGDSSVALLAKIEVQNPSKPTIHVIRCLTGHVYMPEKGGQCALSQMQAGPCTAISLELQDKSNQIARLLPTSQPHREALGRYARLRHP